MKYRLQSIERLATVDRGKFSVRPRNDPRYYGGKYPFIQTGDISQANGVVRHYSQTLNEQGLGVSRLFKKGSLVLTIAANIGDVASVDFDFACPDSVVVLQPKDGIDTIWLKYILQSCKSDFSALATQNAQKNINLEIIRPLQVPTPDNATQKKIASVLHSWDSAIEKAERLIVLKENWLAWIRSQYFTGKQRLKGFTAPWAEHPLSTLLSLRGETSHDDEEVFSVSVHKGLINQIEHLGRSFAAKNTSRYNRVEPGDIVYTRSPTGDFPYGIIKQSKVDSAVIVSPLYGVFKPSSYELGSFLDFFFESDVSARNYLHPLIQKGAKNTINVSDEDFLKGTMDIPSSDKELRALLSIVDAAKEEVRIIHAITDKLTTQKSFLMSKLLTGEWEAPDLGAEAN